MCGDCRDADRSVDEAIQKLSLIRRTCLALPIERAIADQQAGQTGELMRIPLRASDVLYVQGSADRVTVVLSSTFEDPSDAVLGKIFLQEFYDVRQLNRFDNAPAVLFGKEPPNEMKAHISPGSATTNFITLGMPPLRRGPTDDIYAQCSSPPTMPRTGAGRGASRW